MASPRTALGGGRRLPHRPLLIILALLGTLIGASVARAANPPSITGPSGPVNTPPSFTITGLDLATINWNLDGTGTASGSGITSAGTGPLGAADGPYTLHATQTPLDPLDPPSGEATVSFTLDTGAPSVTASATAGGLPYTANTLTNQTVTVHYTCSDIGGSGVVVASCPLDQMFDTSGTFTAQSGTVLDNAGNSASTSFGFIQIDKVPPPTPIGLATPANPTNDTTPTFTWAGGEPGGTFTRQLDGGLQLAAASPFTAPILSNGLHSIAVRQIDGAGNQSLFPAILNFTIDTVRPTVVATVTSPPNLTFPVPGDNLTTAFGPLANIQIFFSEAVQSSGAVIKLCVFPCGGIGLTGTPTFGVANASFDPASPLLVGTRYEIQLLAIRDTAGNLLTGIGTTLGWTFTTSTDGTPPGPVAGLTLVPGIGQIALSWTRPPDADLARITVLRGTTPPASAADATAARFSLPATATSFTDVALTPGVTYHYAVYAEDAVGNPSVLVRSSAVPKAPLVPRPPPPNTISARSMRPKKGKVLATLRPLMRWKATKGAPFYNLQIVDLTTNKKVVSVFTKAPRHRVLKNRLKAGHRYAWRVWAHRSGKGWFSLKRPMTSWFDVSPKAKK